VLKNLGEKIYEHRQELALSFQRKAGGKYDASILYLLFDSCEDTWFRSGIRVGEG
jgi:hypothetical protein